MEGVVPEKQPGLQRCPDGLLYHGRHQHPHGLVRSHLANRARPKTQNQP